MSSSNFRCIDILVSRWKSTIGLGLFEYVWKKRNWVSSKNVGRSFGSKRKISDFDRESQDLLIC